MDPLTSAEQDEHGHGFIAAEALEEVGIASSSSRSSHELGNESEPIPPVDPKKASFTHKTRKWENAANWINYYKI